MEISSESNKKHKYPLRYYKDAIPSIGISNLPLIWKSAK